MKTAVNMAQLYLAIVRQRPSISAPAGEAGG